MPDQDKIESVHEKRRKRAGTTTPERFRTTDDLPSFPLFNSTGNNTANNKASEDNSGLNTFKTRQRSHSINLGDLSQSANHNKGQQHFFENKRVEFNNQLSTDILNKNSKGIWDVKTDSNTGVTQTTYNMFNKDKSKGAGFTMKHTDQGTTIDFTGLKKSNSFYGKLMHKANSIFSPKMDKSKQNTANNSIRNISLQPRSVKK